MGYRTVAIGVACLAALQSASPALAQASDASETLVTHEAMLVLDTHLDSPANFDRPGWSIMDKHDVAMDSTQVDYPRMVEGGLDGGFWVIYTDQGALTEAGYTGALSHALLRASQIRKFVAANPDTFELAVTAADAPRIAASGKRIVYQSIENSYPLGLDLKNLALFHQLGVRMAGPVHSRTNQFADSTTGQAVHGGLSALGKQWVTEMNRLGMVIDASHSSDATFDQMLALSKAPIILSHSGPRAQYDHPRNLDDARMRALAAKGGVMQLNSIFLAPVNPNPQADALAAELAALPCACGPKHAELVAKIAALKQEIPRENVDFDRFMVSLLHTIEVMGIDHVGIGADWDGGGGVIGMNQISQIPRITDALLAKGFSAADIEKIWSGNALRVLAAAEATAKAMAHK